MVIPVVKAAFVPFSAIVGNPANAGAARLCGVSPCPVPDTATALPNHALYHLSYTRGDHSRTLYRPRREKASNFRAFWIKTVGMD